MAPIEATTRKITPREKSQMISSYFLSIFTSAGCAAALGGFTPRVFMNSSTDCADEFTSKPNTCAPGGRLLFAQSRPMPMIITAVIANISKE